MPSRAVLVYNGLHLAVFLVLGTMAAWLALLAERGPHFWYIGAVLLFFVMFHMFGGFLFLSDPVHSALPLWAALGAGFGAARPGITAGSWPVVGSTDGTGAA